MYILPTANLNIVLLSFLSNIIKVNHFLYCFTILLYSISSSSPLCIMSLLVPYVSTESIHCILLSLSVLNEILLTSSVNTLCFSPVNLCFDLNINLLRHGFFLGSLFHFQVELLLGNIYNL